MGSPRPDTHASNTVLAKGVANELEPKFCNELMQSYWGRAAPEESLALQMPRPETLRSFAAQGDTLGIPCNIYPPGH